MSHKPLIIFLLALTALSCHNNSGPSMPATTPPPAKPGPAPNPLESDTLIARNTGIDSAHACS
ncbi:MAG TPA: hypothetical protein VKQ52_08330, partial [Puia sp.]|nr:hypothetical protein [Puia sp.]